jgi:hypothetical protein
VLHSRRRRLPLLQQQLPTACLSHLPAVQQLALQLLLKLPMQQQQLA